MIHALCNAVGSALGFDSLGTYATAMRRSGIRRSTAYLRYLRQHLKRRHLKIRQCSFSLEALRPMIDPLAPRLKKRLASLLKVPLEAIGITATSGEKLTAFGRGEAIRCTASVVLE
jgi:2-C-methyl-D-erythritol 2,4-cyclodiphosphate synthase